MVLLLQAPVLLTQPVNTPLRPELAAGQQAAAASGTEQNTRSSRSSAAAQAASADAHHSEVRCWFLYRLSVFISFVIKPQAQYAHA
jgi:hypothetical protein